MSLPSGFFRTPPQVLSSAFRAKHLIRPAVSSHSYAASSSANSSVVASVPLALSKPVQLPLTTVPSPTPPISHHDPSPIWFDSTTIARLSANGGRGGGGGDRRAKLGRTLRILHERLPSLLQSPLPQEILAPNISLHLFPSTHPYLPAVSGRVGYIAALWTSPIAWNRVPIIGNLRLEILSERMTTQPLYYSPRRCGAYDEQLVVKWRTAGNSNKSGASLAQQGEHNLDHALRGTLSSGSKKEFTGLFIFEFDGEGRIISHTIEHVDQNHNSEWEKGVGAKVVHLADWLLGGIKGRPPQGACPMMVRDDRRDRRDPRLR